MKTKILAIKIHGLEQLLAFENEDKRSAEDPDFLGKIVAVWKIKPKPLAYTLTGVYSPEFVPRDPVITTW